MSTDDQSKKDEQNTTDPVQKPKPEQASPVYLFPENSVYDLEPIVVPDNMKLAAPADDEVTIAAGNSQSWATDEPVETNETKVETPVENSPENATAENSAGENSIAETMPTQENAQTATASVPKPPAPTGILGKLKIIPRKVKATADHSKVLEKHDKIEPSEQTDELVQSAQPPSTSESKTDESPTASGEPAQEAAPAAHTLADANPEWKEHASAVLEHFGWEQAGWSGQKIGTSAVEAQENIVIKAEPLSSSLIEPKASTEEEKKIDPAKEDDSEAKKNFFPEHSAFDLEPIVIPEDQRLGTPVAQKPRIDPRTTAQQQKLSPIKIGQHKPTAKRVEPAPPRVADAPASSPAAYSGTNGEAEVSLAQPDITVPSSNGDQHLVISEPAPLEDQSQQAPEAAIAAPTMDASPDSNVSVEAPSNIEVVPEPTQVGESVSEVFEPEAVEQEPVVSETHMAGFDASVEISEPQSEPAAPVIAEHQSEATPSSEITEQEPTASAPFAEQTESIASAEVSEQHVEPSAEIISEPTASVENPELLAEVSEPKTESESDETAESLSVSPQNETAEKVWNEEQTGWEDIVDKQERWQEQTGWEEAVEEKSEWERSRWSDPDLEDEVPEANISQEDSQEISQPQQATDFQWAQEGNTASGADSDPELTGEQPSAKKPGSFGSLFDDGDDDDENEMPSEVPANQAPPDAAVGIKTLEIEPTERQELENRIGTTTGDSQYSFEPEPSEGNENQSQPVSGQFPAIDVTNQQESAPPKVSGQYEALAEQQTEQFDPHQEEASGGIDINNLGIGTADIDQIILEHNSIQLTMKSGALEEAEEEERVLRELLLKEQRDAEREAQNVGGDPQAQSQEITNPELQNAGVSQSTNEEGASDGEPVYDEEDSLQEFLRPTDSIYELAPFVLPTPGERLTDEKEAKPLNQLQRAVNATAVPERAPSTAYSSDPLVGTTLAHSYEVLDVIGQGGMAIVYRAKQIATGRLVAIKTLKTQSPSDVMRFSQEIKTHSQLEHKNIVDFIDSFTARGQLFLVMERIRGISLEEIIRTFGKLDDPGNIVDILSQILDALEYAHSGGLIHRDLKTGNVILIKEQDEAMVVKILDFGIAKIQGDLQRLTHVGQALGSPIYMSPEQCSGKQLTTRSDLYSLGVVAYETVTGTPPYSKGTLINVMAAHCNENIKPKPLSEMAPHLPKFKMLDQILQKALQTPAEKRWQSAAEFKTALQFWLRSVEMDASYDELPVELMRSPVTEFDMNKLIASASSNTTPSRPTQPSFTWAQEPEPVPAQTASAQEQGSTTGENTGWINEEPEHEDIWPDQQGGWNEGTKPLDSVPGWGEEAAVQSNEAWGGSEKHRQDEAAQSPPAPLTNAPFNVGSQSTDSAQAVPDPNQKLFQSNYQAETSDLWNAQQNQINQRKNTVRDLLASPANSKDEQQSFDVRSSTELKAVGNTPMPIIDQTATPEFKTLFSGENAAASLARTDADTAGGAEAAEVPAGPLDLRRRQAPAQPLPTATNNVLYIVIGIVVGLLFASLFGYYFFIQTDTFHLRPAPEEKKNFDPFNDQSNNPAPNSTESEKQPAASETPSTDNGETESKSDQSDSTEKSKSADDTSNSADTSKSADDTSKSAEDTSKSAEDTTGDASTSKTSTPKSSKEEPTPETATPKTGTPEAKPSDAPPQATEPKKPEPIPFKKGEPEEGVDF